MVDIFRDFDLHVCGWSDETHGCMSGMSFQEPNTDRDVVHGTSVGHGDGTFQANEVLLTPIGECKLFHLGLQSGIMVECAHDITFSLI